MAQAASLWVKLGLSDKEFDQGLKRAENRLKRFGDRLSTLGSRLTMGFSAPLALASGGAIKLAADLEQTKIAFEVMTGSAEKASRMVENLQKMGAKTPYESKDLLESAKTLMLFGVQAEKVEGMLQMLGDVASGSSDKLKSLSLAFAQVQSTGRLTGQDLLQMINAGFNPLQIISEKTGKSMAELKDKMSEGAISADMVTQAFKIATSEGGRFFGMMDKQSGTTLGKFSTLMDNMKLALTNIGTALLPFANKLMEMLMPMTEKLNDLSDAFLKMPQPIQNVVVGVVAFKVALGPILLITGKLITSFSALLGVLRMLPLINVAKGFSSISFAIQAVTGGAATAGEALGMLATAFKPFLIGGAIIAGVAAIVALISKLSNDIRISSIEIGNLSNVSDATKKLEQLKKVRDALQKDLEKEQTKAARGDQYNTFSLTGITANQPVSTQQREAVIAGLTKQIKELDGQIDQTEKKLKDLTNPPVQKDEGGFAEELKKILDEFKSLDETKLTDKEILATRKQLTDKIKALTLSDVEYQKWALNEEKKDFEDTYKGKQEILDLYAEYYDLKMKEIEKANDTWAQQTKQIMADTAQSMEQSLSDSFFDVAKGKFDSFGDYFQNFCDSILRAWSGMLAQAATQKMMSGAFGNWMTNAFGGGGTTSGMVGDFPTTSNFGGYAASGGPVSYGKSYIVGEKGPELFTPNSSGTIIPNNALGGSNVTVQVVNPPGIPLKAKTTQPKFDGKQYVVSVMLEALNNNTGGIRDALGTVR